MTQKLEDKIKELLEKSIHRSGQVEPYYFEQGLKEITEWTYENMKIEGEWGKLTPFQSTLNTYLKNRAEELGIKIK